jgi:Xaa-Pro aminopeptidase
MGALHEGYASDMTRVVFTGTPGRKEKGLYRAVLEAQRAAIDAIRPGIPAAAVDAAARRSLKSRRLHELFTHSTGHGVGLEIHEGPSLRKRESTPLRAGMVVTVEPGVYQPGTGGIRIEDMVLVTAGGCEVLTPTPKELTSIE